MSPAKSDSLLLLCLRLGTFLCLAGWTWGHLYWQGPYGVLLWQEDSYSLAERWGIPWETFVGTGANDGLIQTLISSIGFGRFSTKRNA